LALRFRKATRGDVHYFNSDRESEGSNDIAPCSLPPGVKDHASDINFINVSKKSILQSCQKNITVDDGKEVAYRVFPGPDPDDPDGTKFMTLKQMEKFLHEPSKVWVEAGWGDYGSVYIEILGYVSAIKNKILIRNALTFTTGLHFWCSRIPLSA
jgi:hypothetical protein